MLSTRLQRASHGLSRAREAIAALSEDADKLAGATRWRESRLGRLGALSDTSFWALALIRGSVALRATLGSSLGLSQVLRIGFHIDVWSDDIGPGLRLPHPFNIVIGEGATIGRDCVLLHNVTIQRGEHTRIGDGTVLGTGAVVLGNATIGECVMVGANSVVRGELPSGRVAVGAPARVVRKVRPEEIVR